jgi:hypothetical protein
VWLKECYLACASILIMDARFAVRRMQIQRVMFGRTKQVVPPLRLKMADRALQDDVDRYNIFKMNIVAIF